MNDPRTDALEDQAHPEGLHRESYADRVDDRADELASAAAAGDIEVVEVDEAAALMWAHMRVHLAQTGRRCNVNDLWIAASAASRCWVRAAMRAEKSTAPPVAACSRFTASVTALFAWTSPS